MNLPKMTPDGERVLAAAVQARAELDHAWLGVEHLFLGIAAVGHKELSRAFAEAGQELPRMLDTLRARVRSTGGGAPEGDLGPTPRCRIVFEHAARIAGGARVEPGHMLEAIFREGRGMPVRVMRAMGTDVARVQEALRRDPQPAPTPTPLLTRFGRDLTELGRQNQLGPIIGREKEIQLLAQVLLRKNKNNPVLVGDAGVGKTAVVEGFAQVLLSDDCPEPFKGSSVIELSIGSLVAGTKFRGEFEERLLGIQEEVAAHKEIILFLDEIHSLVGAGATGGGDSLDASNILKPALARGELRCIGATTIEEFRLHIERDSALDRRFERVLIEEPSAEDALEILRQISPGLESHHDVQISPEALETAVELSIKHVHDRNLPDKAIDAIDQTCARLRLQRYEAKEPQLSSSSTAGSADVARTISQWTGIPLERISGKAAVHLLNLEQELRQLVVGQDHAVRAVTRTILTAKAGLSDPNRPLGVFFFGGPTGVGKTQLAKSLAQVLFGDEKRLVRVDMSEYMEAHSVAGLIGAPPGYVGHDREGVLISALRTHPHCIVLFDEIEKAHPQVWDIFLQVFDEGRLTGTRGKSADFTQAVIILTSNLRSASMKVPVGFGSNEEEAPPQADPRDELLQHLRPELVNRIDEIVPFDPLTPDALRIIIDHSIASLEQLLESRDLRLELDDAVYTYLLELGDCATFGARELNRVVDRHVRQPLAEEVLKLGDDMDLIRVAMGTDGLTFEAHKDHEQIA